MLVVKRGGNIAINARNLDILGGSEVQGGTFASTGLAGGQSGDIILNATGAIAIGSSTVDNSVGIGNAGDIEITTVSLTLNNGALLDSRTFGQGDAGNVIFDVDGAVEIVDGKIFSNVRPGGVGNGGEINIQAGSLSLSDGAQITSSTFATGNAGNVILDVDGAVEIVDGRIFSNVEAGGVGNGGEINIQAGSLSLIDGGQIQSRLRGSSDTVPGGRGQGGKVNIDVRDRVTLAGVNQSILASGILTDVDPGAVGNAGNIQIKAGSLTLRDGAFVQSSTDSQGNAGNVTIDVEKTVTLSNNADIFSNINSRAIATGKPSTVKIKAGSLFITDADSSISTSTFATGNAGNVIFDVDGAVELVDGTIFSNVEAGAVGDGGTVSINSGFLSLTDGGQIIASANAEDDRQNGGLGNAGNVLIDVKGDVIVSGKSQQNGQLSAIFTDVDPGAVGNAGNIQIKASSLTLRDGAFLESSTGSKGNAGNVTIDVEKAVTLSNDADIFSNIESDAVATGEPSTVKINAGSLLIADADSSISTSTFATGNAGNVIFDVDGAVEIVDGKIFSNVGAGGVGNGGEINIQAGSLSLINGAQITSSTFATGNAGNVTINAEGSVELVGGDIFSTVEPGGIGNGGEINVTARNFSLSSGSELLAQTRGNGNAGNIRVNATDSVIISGVAPFLILDNSEAGGASSGLLTNTEKTANGQAGDIKVTTSKLQITDGGVLSARTRNDFTGGNITVNANTLDLTGGGQILTTTFSGGNAGNINLIVSDRIQISGSDPTYFERIQSLLDEGFSKDQVEFTIDPVSPQSGIFANTAPGSTGRGGNIFIDPKQVTIKDDGTISAKSVGTGEAGNITLIGDNLTLDRGTITAESSGASGGNINLNIRDLLLLRRNSQISATAGTEQGAGNGGNININTGLLIGFPKENSDITANAFAGTGGKVNIQAEAIFGIKPLSRAELQRLLNTTDPNLLDPSRLNSSEITAISQENPSLSGQVNISTPDIDPSKGLVELPENVVDPRKQIAQNPCKQGLDSEFNITGRGGLPPSPNQVLSNDSTRVRWVEPAPTVPTQRQYQRTESDNSSIPNPKSQTPNPIIPARGWVFNEKNQVVLTAYDPTMTTSSPRQINLTGCTAR